MKILAIFDGDVFNPLANLKKLQHSVDLVNDLKNAQKMLASRTYDVILCQPFLKTSGLGAHEILKAVRENGEQNDVPFVCCQTDAAQLSGDALAEMAATIRTLGGQGVIEQEVFNSRNLIHSISKCMTAAVGSPCVTSAWR